MHVQRNTFCEIIHRIYCTHHLFSVNIIFDIPVWYFASPEYLHHKFLSSLSLHISNFIAYRSDFGNGLIKSAVKQ